MRAQKDYTMLLFFDVIYLILFIACSSAKVNDEYEYQTPIEKRIKSSLSTICVEIKPSHSQEDPYLICKGGKLPGFVQVPYTKNNIFLGNDRNFKSMSVYEQAKNNYVARQPFLHFENVQFNINKENSWPEDKKNCQYKVLFNQNPSQQSNFVNRYTQPTHSNSETTTPRLNSYRDDQRLPTSMPFILSTVEYKEDNKIPSRQYNSNNKYLKKSKVDEDAIALCDLNQSNYDYFTNFGTKNLESEKWDFNLANDNSADSLQYLLNAPIPGPEIKMASPTVVKELPLVNDAIQSAVIPRDNPYEWKRKYSDENRLELDWTGIQLNSEAGSFPQPLPESYREKQIFKNTLTFSLDKIMQEFYNSFYDTPVLTISHSEEITSIACQQIFSEISNPNKQYSAESIQNEVPHTIQWIQSIQEGQCDDFRKESNSVSEAPSNRCCKVCPPETGFTLPPIIITLTCYNPSSEHILPDSLSCYRYLPPTYNRPPYERLVCENQYFKQLETKDLVGSSYNLLFHIFQPKLFPYFSMIPRLCGLLGPASALLPTSHVADTFRAHGIFRSTTPIPEISRSNPLTYASQPALTEFPLSNFPNYLRPHIEDATVAVQLDNMQTTTLPMTTSLAGSSDVDPSISVKSIEDLQNSTFQSQSQIRNFKTAKPIAITQASITEDWNRAGEESTKKFLTIIEKARRLHFRHKINSN